MNTQLSNELHGDEHLMQCFNLGKCTDFICRCEDAIDERYQSMYEEFQDWLAQEGSLLFNKI